MQLAFLMRPIMVERTYMILLQAMVLASVSSPSVVQAWAVDSPREFSGHVIGIDLGRSYIRAGEYAGSSRSALAPS